MMSISFSATRKLFSDTASRVAAISLKVSVLRLRIGKICQINNTAITAPIPMLAKGIIKSCQELIGTSGLALAAKEGTAFSKNSMQLKGQNLKPTHKALTPLDVQDSNFKFEMSEAELFTAENSARHCEIVVPHDSISIRSAKYKLNFNRPSNRWSHSV